MARLTDAKARNMEPGDRPLAHGGVTGLSLHPSSRKGRGKWVLRYVSPVTGKRRNAGVGSYPEVRIAEAARSALLMRDQLSAGIDPLIMKADEAKAEQTPSFQKAAEELHTELLPGWKNVKHGQQWINTLNQYAFPVLAHLPLNEIQPKHVADALRPIWLEKPETARRVKQRIHAVMSWGWAHGHCRSNPVDVVHHLLAQQPARAVRTQHQPAMAWREIPEFVKTHLHEPTSRDVTRTMLEFLILTACRSGEARGMTWNEVDMDTGVWSIPATRMKANQSHRIPLSTQARRVLDRQRGLHDRLVFPSPRAQTELSDMVLTVFLRRVKARSQTKGRYATAHGFRSSFRDWCSENGYERDLAERALAHVISNKVEAAYHRTDLLELRRPMMQAWSDYVMSAVTP